MSEKPEQDWLIREDPNTLAAMKARGEGVTFASPLKAPTGTIYYDNGRSATYQGN